MYLLTIHPSITLVVVSPDQNEDEIMEAVEGLDVALDVDESIRSVAQLATGKEVRVFG